MIIGAVISFVIALGLAIACIYVALSDSDDAGIAVILAAIHAVFIVLGTILLCLHSPKASFVCGAVGTAFAGVLFLVVFFCDDDTAAVAARWGCTIMIVADLACCTAGYLNTYAFLEWAISCTVLCVMAVINFLVAACLYKYAWRDKGECAVNVINLILVALTVAGLVFGYVENIAIAKGVGASVDAAIYQYNDSNSELGEQITDEDSLYFNECYALRVDIDFTDLYALSTGSQEVAVSVSFPAKILRYVSDGVGFQMSETKNVWTSDRLTLTARSNKHMKIGYFAFQYSSETLNASDSSIVISVLKYNSEASSDSQASDGKPSDSQPTDGKPSASEPIAESICKSSCTLRYSKHEYEFGIETHVKKDLSVMEEGRYRIAYPVGCEAFRITIRDLSKVGVYHEATIAKSKGVEYYLLDIPAMLEANVEEAVYNKLVNEHGGVAVEITALENGDYFGKSIVMEFTF